ncbi:LolA family protein [Desulforamulus ferrireducens]|uniref:DUF4412 domain-containing protein n=1 Tax=Desulforamulus ferrireducens TaxID=1833852 RepID=A0A1S6ISA5_9FIRM|nr:DUF4412 domain-containing protein [Desulforamulus ferrireducens]AQS57663.1 hypothetical protein B0537_00075 [Desulforamulus ferrireducens]
MRKLLQMVLLLGALALFFVGCGGDQTAADKPAEEKAKTETASQSGDNLASLFAKAEDIKCLSYSITMSSEGKQMLNGKMYLKGNKTKMEFSAEGMSAIMFVDTEEKVAYNYLPSEQMATRIDFSQAVSQMQKSPLDYNDQYREEQYKIVGEEKVNGYDCKAVEVTSSEGLVKMWVSKEYGIPVRIESVSEGKPATIDFTDIKLDELPDSEFALPAGVQVIDMQDMMKNLPLNLPQ